MLVTMTARDVILGLVFLLFALILLAAFGVIPGTR